MSCYLVIGTGRSGTSLAMQALAALGVTVPGELVPASENNLRGTGEAIEFRDQCRDLHGALENFGGFRPDGWLDEPAAEAARDWMAGFLTRTGAARQPIALKFPLSGLFLPLWQQAAQEAACPLRLVWATRGTGQVMRSLVAAYGASPRRAAQVWGQRSYYLLRDAPDDTLLLPFEGWAADPAGQVAALAKLTGAPAAARKRAAAQFSARLDHSTEEPAPMRDAVRAVAEAVDAMLAGKCGELGKLVDRDGLPWLEAMTALSDLVVALVPRAPFSTDETEMRLRLLARLEETGVRSAKVDEELGILSNRIKSLAAENRTLRRQPPAAPAIGPVHPTAELEEKQAEIERLTVSNQRLDDELGAVQDQLAAEVAKAAELREAFQRLSAQRDRLEEEIEGRYRQRLNLAERRDVNQAKRIEQFSATRERLNKRIEALTTDNGALKTRRDTLLKRVDALEKQLQAVTTQRDTLQGRVKTLTEANRANAARCEVLKKRVDILTAAQSQPAAQPAATPDLNVEVLEHELDLARLEAAELAQRLREAEQVHAEVLNSRSWRMTQPLRVVLARLKQGRD